MYSIMVMIVVIVSLAENGDVLVRISASLGHCLITWYRNKTIGTGINFDLGLPI